MRLGRPGDAAKAAALATGDDFTLTQFVDYRSEDGWYRKYRIAFVGGHPFLCHMAASEHWMVHYLNAGMDQSPCQTHRRGGSQWLGSLCLPSVTQSRSTALRNDRPRLFLDR